MARNFTQKYELPIGLGILSLTIIFGIQAVHAETTIGRVVWGLLAIICGLNALVCFWIWLTEKNQKDEPAQ